MKHPEIPSFAYRLFKWFCKDPIFEELEGDLEESFLANKEKYGLKKARRIYTREILRMIRPTVVSKPRSGPGYHAALIGSYVTISLRNLRKQKLFSFINIFSLSVAMSSGLLVIGMITDLLKFDEFHTHKNEVYRVITTPYYNAKEYKTQASSPLYLGKEMMQQIPGIKITNLGRRFGGDALVNDKRMNIHGIYADDHFFDFLSFELLNGSPSDLAEPFNLFLTESFAAKTFEDSDPIGKSIEIDGLGTFQVTGIVADPPQFSHIQYEVIASLSSVHLLAKQELIDPTHDQWTNLDRYYNYIYIPDNKQKVIVEQWLASSAKDFYTEPEKATATFKLQPINEIIPGPNISDSIGPKMIYLPIIILSVIAGAILLSAIFNYTNLSMARSLRRAREVGVRKLNGASGTSIFGQFTVEAIVLSLLSLGVGILLFLSLRTHFIQILPRAEEMVILNLSPRLVGWFVLFSIITGLIAGMAPSLFFSRLSSLKALRSGKVLKALSGVNFRKGLIVAQFALSIIFVLAVVIMHKQYRYSINLDMGYNKENILNVQLQDNDPEIVKTEFLKVPGVSEVSFSSFIPGVGQWQNKQLVDPRNMDSVWVHQMFIDEAYLDNMSIQLVAGRNFRPNENGQLETSILVNETFTRNFGLDAPAEALGTVFQLDNQSVEIVGVIKDIIYSNLEEEINSFILRKQDFYSYANLKVASSDVITTLERIEDSWNTIDTNHRMSASFLDEHIEGYYVFLVDFMKLFGFVGFLAISISCLGLFGMAIYSTQTRMKEIGIRKTFGASEKTLILLLSKGFIKMVLWAVLIGTPICYLVFDKLILEQHVFRPEITIVEIGISVLFLLVICLLTIITQTRNAARRNPSAVLRDE